ncbi:MAG: hypothetical protein R3362_09270 [Rhodothermales bacterium]|nr:hypothetical protein [Rhodothermales bacterium]
MRRAIPLLGLLAIGLIAARAWRAGSDSLGASAMTVLVAAVVVGHGLWARPRPAVAAALIVGALLVGLLW